ncbi:mucin-17-like [Lithobates pipiens]
MEAKTIISIILGVTLLVAVAKWKWNVQPEHGLEPRDLTKVIENEQKPKYVSNQEEEKTKQEESFPLPNKLKQPRNTENIYIRRKKYSGIHPHLNKQFIHAKQEAELLQENFSHWYSHNVEIIAESESESGSRITEGSGAMESTTQRISQTYTTAEGSGEGPGDTTPSTTTDIFTTPEGSGDIEKTPQTTLTSIAITAVNDTTTSPIATSPTSTTPYCQNGGSYDGFNCICGINFIGGFCEIPIGDRIVIGKTVLATIMVEMKITNRAYHEKFQDPSSFEYKKFEVEFTNEMYIYFSNIEDYVGVEIKQIRPGSGSARKGRVFARSADVSARSGDMNVNYDVNFRIPLRKDLNMTTDAYSKPLQILEEQLDILQQCTNDKSGFCIDGNSLKIEVKLKTVEELCMEKLPEGFKEFYSPYFFTDDELTCISDCDDSSEKYNSCNTGTCQIRYKTGRACFCPDTDIYLYMYSDCKGPILKSGVYGGVGVAIAVLFLALITVAYFLFRRGKDKKLLEPFANDQQENWSEENESEWHVDRGITNLYETNGDSSISSREKFKPVLDKIDTTIEIKIQRPELARL